MGRQASSFVWGKNTCLFFDFEGLIRKTGMYGVHRLVKLLEALLEQHGLGVFIPLVRISMGADEVKDRASKKRFVWMKRRAQAEPHFDFQIKWAVRKTATPASIRKIVIHDPCNSTSQIEELLAGKSGCFTFIVFTQRTTTKPTTTNLKVKSQQANNNHHHVVVFLWQ